MKLIAIYVALTLLVATLVFFVCIHDRDARDELTPPSALPGVFHVSIEAPPGITSELQLRPEGAEARSLGSGEGSWDLRDQNLGELQYATVVLSILGGVEADYRVVPPAERNVDPGKHLYFEIQPIRPPEPVVEIIRQVCRITVTEGRTPIPGVRLTIDPADLGAPGTTGPDGTADIQLRGAAGISFKVRATPPDRAPRTSDSFTLRPGDPITVSIRYPAPTEVLEYLVNVTLDGERRVNATVTPSRGGNASRTDNSGTARLSVDLERGASFTFKASFEGSEAVSGSISHSGEAASSRVQIDVPSSIVTAIYVARALRDGRPFGNLPVRIVDRRTGERLGQESTDRRGIARIQIRARRDTDLEATAIVPAEDRERLAQGDPPAPISHTRYPADTLRFTFATRAVQEPPPPTPPTPPTTPPPPPPPPPPPDPGPVACESLDHELRQAVEVGWWAAFTLLLELPGRYGTRDVARQEPAVKDSIRSLNRRLEDIKGSMDAADCSQSLRRDYYLAAMLAAAVQSDTTALVKLGHDYDRLPQMTKSDGIAARHLYTALCLTMTGIVDPPQTTAAADDHLARSDALFEQSTRHIRAQISGRRYGVEAALRWQISQSPSLSAPDAECGRALRALDRWQTWLGDDIDCRGRYDDIDCRDRWVIDKFRNTIRCQ